MVCTAAPNHWDLELRMTNQMCRGGRSATTMNNMLMIKGQVLTCLLFIVMKLWCSSWTTGPWGSISFFHSRLPFCSFQLNLSVILDVFLLILQTIDSLGCCEYKGGYVSGLIYGSLMASVEDFSEKKAMCITSSFHGTWVVVITTTECHR